MKKLFIVKHVDFEGPGIISNWADEKNIEIEIINSWENSLPEIFPDEGVILMGGPMSVNDGLLFINEEIKWVKALIEQQKHVVGICLGAQVIAKAMRANVFKADEKEIGWFPVKIDGNFKEDDIVNSLFQNEEMVFHWHGEIFDLPKGCKRIFFNEISKCQAFFNKKIFGFQFHMETTLETADLLIKNCFNELQEKGKFIQKENFIKKDIKKFDQINLLMKKFLDCWYKL